MASCSILVCNGGSGVAVVLFIFPSGTEEDSSTREVRLTASDRPCRVEAHP